MWNDHFISVREVRFGHLAADAYDLVQLYAQLAVELLNAEDRRQANLDNLERVEAQVHDEAYFRNSWQHGLDSARTVLAALARGEAPDLGGPARRWLRRRELINEGAG